MSLLALVLACAAPSRGPDAAPGAIPPDEEPAVATTPSPDQVVRAAAAERLGVAPETLRVQPLYLDGQAPYYRVRAADTKPRSDGVMPGVSFVVLDGVARSGAEGYEAVRAATDDPETLAAAWLYLYRGGAEEILGYANDGLPRPARGDDGLIRFVYADARGQRIDVALNAQVSPPEATVAPRPRP
ncbi:hypothetical protein L6R49_04045 [Myxococcota bacterium]|nr:hypothetical protein [Myxococcota bacterium]